MNLVVKLNIFDILLNFSTIDLVFDPQFFFDMLFWDSSFINEPIDEMQNIHLLDLYFQICLIFKSA